MGSRSRASPKQFAALLEFMERHGDISRPPKGAQGRIKADRLWQALRKLLNSISGGVIKSMDKWKKVWADWKAKTKKKALAIRREACGTGGGPSSRRTLTDLEHRVLGIMGLTGVVGQDGNEERGFDTPSTQRDSLPPATRDSVHFKLPSQTATDEVVLDSIPTHSIEGDSPTAPSSLPLSSEVSQLLLTQVPTPPPAPVSTPVPTSPNATTSQRAPRRRHPATPAPMASPTSTPRRQRLLQERTRRVQTPFERATSEFVAVEIRRLQFEEDRERNNHQREMEHLRLESRRIEMEENRNQTLNRLARVLDNLTEILPQLRASSLPSTDILP